MNIFNLLKLSIRALQKNIFRTFLTMLGIIIGVMSVIAMLAIGEGSKQSIEDSISSLGANMIMVFPGANQMGGVSLGSGTSANLEMSNIEVIESYCPAVEYVTPVAAKKVQAISGLDNWSTTIQGAYPNYLAIKSLEVQSGRIFSMAEVERAVKVCLIGTTVLQELFGPGEDPIGASIRVDKVPFTIIGVLEEKGGGMMGDDQDDIILAPFSTVQRRLLGITTVPQIYASAFSEELIKVAADQITNALYEDLKVTEDDEAFSLRTMDEISNMLSSTSSIMVGLLGFVAGISLVVGGIGIMNIMYVTVVERTREIGLRMAVGAKSNNILWQFLTEAVVISVAGGIIGVLVGAGIAFAVSSLMNWPVTITAFSIVLSFGFSTLIGIFFGWYPAKKAASLIPIEALRYE